MLKRPLPRISYDEAIEILKKNNVELEWGKDISGADETIISNQYDRPVIVHRYPADSKSVLHETRSGQSEVSSCNGCTCSRRLR